MQMMEEKKKKKKRNCVRSTDENGINRTGHKVDGRQ